MSGRPRGRAGRLRVLAWAFALLVGTAGGARAGQDCFLATDLDSGRVVMEQGDCAIRHTPASTFKIALSLMGFDAGILKSPSAPELTPGPDADTSRPATRGPQTPASWIRNSVVWYSQDLVRTLGPARVQHYLDAFAYGTRDMSGLKGGPEPLIHFWLSSSLRISPREQVDFLSRMLKGKLPVSDAAVGETTRLLLQPEQPAGWALFGKTGSGSAARPDGQPDRSRPVGWFVGFARKAAHTVVFARFLSRDAPGGESLGLVARRQCIEALTPLLASQGP